MLEHSLVLEKLTLQLSKRPEPTTVLEGSYYPLENLPAISKDLKVVEIKCRRVDGGRVCRILELLSRFVNVTSPRLTSNWLHNGQHVSVSRNSSDDLFHPMRIQECNARVRLLSIVSAIVHHFQS